MTEPLRLIQGNPAQHLAKRFFAAFKSATGRPCGFRFGQMIGMWRRKFEYPDEETGELYIEYPDDEVFDNELAGFFNDPYARDAGFPFNLFYKGYGNYSGKAPRRSKPKPQPVEPIDCPDCHGSKYPGQDCQHCLTKRAETL